MGAVDSGHDGFSPGVIVTGQPLFFVNGLMPIGNGDMSVIHAHPNSPPHVGTVQASSKLRVNGINIAMDGDITGCGASLVGGNPLFTIS